MYHLQCVNQSYWGVLSNLANQSYLVCLDREPLRHLYFNGSNIACWTGSKLFLLFFFYQLSQLSFSCFHFKYLWKDRKLFWRISSKAACLTGHVGNRFHWNPYNSEKGIYILKTQWKLCVLKKTENVFRPHKQWSSATETLDSILLHAHNMHLIIPPKKR